MNERHSLNDFSLVLNIIHPKEFEIDDNSFEFQMDDIKSKLAVMRKLHLQGIYLMVTI